MRAVHTPYAVHVSQRAAVITPLDAALEGVARVSYQGLMAHAPSGRWSAIFSQITAIQIISPRCGLPD